MTEKQYNILMNMLISIEKMPNFLQPSPFWRKLCDFQITQLKEFGFNNFKRTLNMKYYHWSVLKLLRQSFVKIFFNYLKKPNIKSLLSHTNINGIYSLKDGYLKKNNYLLSNIITKFYDKFYAFYILELKNYLIRKNIDFFSLIYTLTEPEIGNPIIVKDGNKSLSQDLLNSIHEFYSILRDYKNLNDYKNILTENKIHILEIGAGYGRLAYVFLSALRNSTYTIVDIPPALFLSQEYLKNLFPNRKIMEFREFNNFKEIKNEFDTSEIRFILPHQLKLIPEKSIDISININSFQEMTKEQIHFYISEINRITKKYFYTKQWIKSRTKKDNKFTIKREEYPFPKTWRILYNEKHELHSLFFHALYKIQ